MAKTSSSFYYDPLLLWFLIVQGTVGFAIAKDMAEQGKFRKVPIPSGILGASAKVYSGSSLEQKKEIGGLKSVRV